MAEKAQERAEADRLRAAFEAAGASAMEFDILQPAEALLDLYGEDIRARAFVTHDPVRGEMMLRPDFTVPLVSRLAAGGREGAGRYTYSGEVFRRQEDQPDRASEYLQVGFEVVGGDDAAAADAEVFARIRDLLTPLGLTAAMGDIGLLRDAVESLTTSEARKASLRHHLWRPRRFDRLLNRYAEAATQADDMTTSAMAQSGAAAEVGLRSRHEVEARLQAMTTDRETPPLPADEVSAMAELTAVNGTSRNALNRLADLAERLPGLLPAIQRLERRLDALDAAGVDTGSLPFDVAHGRTSMEYYDGMVFGLYAEGRDDIPPVATGGRYDALTTALGVSLPAVGGVIRPGVAVALEAGA